jgi:hypothetical protein
MSSNQSVIRTQVQLISNDQQAINTAYQVADFALEERNKRDQNRVLPTEQVIQFSQKGLGGIRVPQHYGGAFVSNKTLAHVFRILSKADANVGQIPQNQFGLLNFINITGSDAQKQFIYTEILAGKRIANGGPEKNSKDTKAIQTTLSLENGQYFLNGEKFYSTGTSFADWLAIRALHPEGYTVLAIVDRYAAGVEVINDWKGFGQRTTASGTVKLHNVVVDPALFFDERIIADTPNVRGAYSQLLQVAIDVGIASLDHLTQGRLGWNIVTGYPLIVGSGTEVAEYLIELLDQTGIDGFNLTRTVAPESHHDFIRLVIPELQQRGRYKTEYATGSLRNKLFAQGDHLAASHPANQFRCRPHNNADDLKIIEEMSA